MKIGILMAMTDEAQPVIERFRLQEMEFKKPIRIFKNEENSLFLGINGKCNIYDIDNVGTQAAAINAFAMVNDVKPDIIINAGTAGGFVKHKAKIGDVYISYDKFIYHDRRIPLPKFEEYGYGSYKVINTNILAKKFNLKQGIFTSGDALDHTEKDLEIIHKFNASVKDMEVAAMAWICQMYEIPFFSIKAITDLVDGDTPVPEDFIKNFKLSVANMEHKLFEIIEFIRNKKISEIFK